MTAKAAFDTASPRLRSRWRSASPATQDAALAIVTTVVTVAFLLVEPLSAALGVVRAPDFAGVGLVVGMSAPLAWRRRAPVGSLVVPYACALVAAVEGYGATLNFAAVWLATGSAALHTDRRTTVALAVLCSATLMIGLSSDAAGGPSPANVATGLVLGLLPPVIGESMRLQRRLTDDVRERAARLEELQLVELNRARAEERVAIARDVHDVVGHHLSAISLQANAGKTLAHRSPEGAEATFEAIRKVSVEALDETRRILGLLRDGDLELTPSPRICDIEALVARLGGTDVDASIEIRGTRRELPVPVETCVYRVAREAVTNVVRHASPARATLIVEYRPNAIELEVADDGARTGTTVSGHGITGMRERTGLLGGTLRAGPRAGGGWTVHAWIPTA